MIWFKINDNWSIDLTQIREFGIPKDRSNSILITYKDGKEEFYSSDDPRETFNRLNEYINIMFSPMFTTPLGSDEILKTMEVKPNGLI